MKLTTPAAVIRIAYRGLAEGQVEQFYAHGGFSSAVSCYQIMKYHTSQYTYPIFGPVRGIS